tara:strand:- start:230 stop:442 length:213 start_codon:yes stop_codon:yes gene_type:complete
MDVEKIISEEPKSSKSTKPEVKNGKSTGRVDMNHLLARVRNEKKNENKISFITISLFLTLFLLGAFIFSF